MARYIIGLNKSYKTYLSIRAGKLNGRSFVQKTMIREEKTRMKKRLVSVLLCTTMLATMLAGCGGGDGGSSNGGGDDTKAEKGSAEDFDWKNCEGTTINVMFNEHNYSKAVISKLDEFEEKTGITVEYSSTPEGNYFDKLNTSLSSRSGTPDVFMTGAYQVWEYASAGYMEPLDDYINDPAKTASD